MQDVAAAIAACWKAVDPPGGRAFRLRYAGYRLAILIPGNDLCADPYFHVSIVRL